MSCSMSALALGFRNGLVTSSTREFAFGEVEVGSWWREVEVEGAEKLISVYIIYYGYIG